MVIVFLSFEAIEIAYTDAVDITQHIVISEKSPGVSEVIKEGVKLRRFLDKIAEIKEHQMVEESHNKLLQTPVFICLSAKSKKISQPILQLISQAFESYVIYAKIDKNQLKDLPFNRSALIGNEICYGQGYPQLRQKEQLRLAVSSIFHEEILNNECIFIEKNANQLKQLKKEGFQNIISQFQFEVFLNAYKLAEKVQKPQQNIQVSEVFNEYVTRFPFAKSYLRNLLKVHKEISIKQIVAYDSRKLSIFGFLNDLFRQTTYYNISPKSWAPHPGSKQTSTYIFHNVSNLQLCLARASKVKQFTNEEQFEVKILAYYFCFIINPSSYALTQDKISSLMKFCKIKSNQNKKAFFNVRPYIEGLQTVNQLNLPQNDILSIFVNGIYRERQVRGLGGLLLTSLILNDSFSVKSLCQQIAFLSLNSTEDSMQFVSRQMLNESKADLWICRVDFHKILDLANYREINEIFLLSNRQRQIKIKLKDLHSNVLLEMRQLLSELTSQRLRIIRSLVIYYRWNTKVINYYDVILHRLSLISQALKDIPILPRNVNNSLLNDYPELACLLLRENYDYFIVPSKNVYSPIQFNFDAGPQAPKQTQNPYLVYINKACSFGIYHISFPVLTFLQWIKSTNKYQLIQYISMINHTFQDYVIMDKRLKLQSTNQKKNAILIVDHVELCETLINRPKSIKTVMIFRLRKISQVEDVGMVTSEVQKCNSFQQSEDQLINVLMRQASQQFNSENQFYLYDWVFKTYIRIKCSLYKLDFNTALQFSLTLLKAISTNRHRLKEIKQNHPKLYVYLYVLPIIKDNQKVVYNYKLFEFLHMCQLFDKILTKKWNCRLETYQNSSVVCWRSIIGTELSLRLAKSLAEYLQLIEAQENPLSFDCGQSYNDCLELIRTLLESPNKEEQQRLPYQLYFEVFADCLNVKNYEKIQNFEANQQFYAVKDENAITLSTYVDNESLALTKSQNQMITCYCFHGSEHILLLKHHEQKVWIQRARVTSPPLSSTPQETLIINSQAMKDILRSSKKTSIKLFKSEIIIISQTGNKLFSLTIPINQANQQQIREYGFDEEIVDTTLVDGTMEPYIICATVGSLYAIKINDWTVSDPLLLKKLPARLNQSCKLIFTKKTEVDLQVLVFENSKLEISTISSAQLIHTTHLQFPKSILSLTLFQNILFVFYHGEDSLYLYKMKEQSYERLWRYFWVDFNAKELHANQTMICLIGGSYLKKIRLRNLETIVGEGSK